MRDIDTFEPGFWVSIKIWPCLDFLPLSVSSLVLFSVLLPLFCPCACSSLKPYEQELQEVPRRERFLHWNRSRVRKEVKTRGRERSGSYFRQRVKNVKALGQTPRWPPARGVFVVVEKCEAICYKEPSLVQINENHLEASSFEYQVNMGRLSVESCMTTTEC